jgi:predicted Zn-dependent protease
VVDAFLGGDKTSQSSQLIMAALGVGYQVGVQLPFSRDDESAADEIGLMLMAEAGYDPESAVPFWERMQSLGSAAQPEFLSTHPAHEARIARLRQLMPKAKEVYLKGGAPR